MTSQLVYAILPSAWYKDVTGKTPDPWQAAAMDSPAKRQILNCCRQSGKSEVMAVRLAHKAVFFPGSLCLAISPTLRQSGELFRRTLGLLKDAQCVEDTKTQISLPNKSRIVSLPGTEGNIRGYAGVNLLCIDEAARTEPGLYAALAPMLAVSNGSLIMASTPWGPQGIFFDIWQDSTPEQWEKTLITATDCPRITPVFLEQERARMGLFFEQEYFGRFLASENSVFQYAQIQRLLDDGVEPLFPANTGLYLEGGD
ncbi:MAG: terminase family protein [Methanoregula sp.]|jgi:hypothetical protein|uniref:terminase large subunit domain-containing protein n=1 Tax=Methanoregula sp. TaxID=2052170 RepID=UPI003D1099E3